MVIDGIFLACMVVLLVSSLCCCYYKLIKYDIEQKEHISDSTMYANLLDHRKTGDNEYSFI